MKTKDVIAMLQKEDPSGEIDVCVGNIDISYISKEPAYYDGSQQVLIKDEEGRAIGGKYKRKGHKIQIDLLPFSELVWEHEVEIDYSELGDRAKDYKENHDNIRKAAIDFDHELELENFTKHIKGRVGEVENVDSIIKDFYTENISPYDAIPDDIPFLNKSYIDRRNIQWSREVEVNLENGLVLKREKKNGQAR